MACVFQSNRLLCLFSASWLKLVKLSLPIPSKNRPTFRMKSGICLGLKKCWLFCLLEGTRNMHLFIAKSSPFVVFAVFSNLKNILHSECFPKSLHLNIAIKISTHFFLKRPLFLKSIFPMVEILDL